jgi:hypothetical protein
MLSRKKVIVRTSKEARGVENVKWIENIRMTRADNP